MNNENENLKEKIETKKEQISSEELVNFFRKKLPNFTVSCDSCGVNIEKTFEGIDYGIEFVFYSKNTNVSIINPWPVSREELVRMYYRDIKAISAFSRLEKNPNYQLSLPLEENDLRDFLEDLDE
jgi:hypothetical protein